MMLVPEDIPDKNVRDWHFSRGGSSVSNPLWLKTDDLVSHSIYSAYIDGYYAFIKDGRVTANNPYLVITTKFAKESQMGYGKLSPEELLKKATSRLEVISSMQRTGFDINQPIELLVYRYANQNCRSIKDRDGREISFHLYDGHHRVCAAKFCNIGWVPAIFGRWPRRSIEYLVRKSKEQKWTWYQPFEVDGLIFENPNQHHHGRKKYEFIIKRNLEPIAGRTFLDLGCNAGVITACIAEGKAKFVTGIDYPSKIKQAWALQETFWIDYGNLHFQPMNLRDIDKFKAYLMSNRPFDAILMTNFIYYLGDSIDSFVDICSGFTTQIVLQGNNLKRHENVPSFRLPNMPHYRGEYSQIDGMVDLLRRHGFKTKVDAPDKYSKPVVVGTK